MTTRDEAGHWQTRIAVRLNRLILMAVAKGSQQSLHRDHVPPEDRITDADIDKLEGEIKQAILALCERVAQETREERWPPVDAREYRRRTGIEVDNHHNALTCPYCNPERLALIHPTRLRDLEAAAQPAPPEAER